MPPLKNKFLKPTEHLRNLQLLEEISKDSTISQRKLALRLGTALGVTNACLKKMVNKGLVKAKGINHKRIAYYLTPKGFSEKTKLTYHFLQHTIRFYSNLKDNITDKLSILSKDGPKRIICYGAGEVLEVAFVILSEMESQFSVLGIVDDDRNKQGKKVFGHPVQQPEVIPKLKPDVILVTSIKYKDKIMRNLSNSKEFSEFKIFSL
ncbi:MAG: winged helix-turn-helix transcriptional regulator [Candidatus Omnitrophica bacterium]|nr:winged helix-turn-helix transcriptional regulator [Candidatus Omnitrophota bacterium]